MESHLSAYAGILTSAAGDREHGVAAVEEWPFHSNLPVVDRQRPEALPSLADRCADAPAIACAEVLFVRLVVNLV